MTGWMALAGKGPRYKQFLITRVPCRLLSARPRGTILRISLDEASGQNTRGAWREHWLLGRDAFFALASVGRWKIDSSVRDRWRDGW
jgi:hypothetical protein